MGQYAQPCRGYRANAFLDSLGHADVALLEPFFEEIHYRAGDRLDATRSDGRSIVFPISLVISIGLASHDSAVGLVGREGLVGWSALLSSASPTQQATVLLDGGSALAIPVERMREACDRSPTLALEVLHFASAYIDQMSLTASAMTCATLHERLAAWLLMLHDRIEGDFIRITHKLLATQLGVRRASITDLLHVIEGEGAVQCDRNVVFMRDRTVLERMAGNAYANVPKPESSIVAAMPGPLLDMTH